MLPELVRQTGEILQIAAYVCVVGIVGFAALACWALARAAGRPVPHPRGYSEEEEEDAA